MNYYERHIGDWVKDTVELSMLEDGAYNRLVDQSYQREAPLPADKRDVYRLARANSTPERKAVDYVLSRYFELREDGWHQKRIEAEIARYAEKKRKAKASADARWGNSEGNADAPADGMRPDMRTHSVGNALQSPVPSPQPPHPTDSSGGVPPAAPPAPTAPPPTQAPTLPPPPPPPRALRKCPPDFAVTAAMVQWAAGAEGAPLLDEAALRRETAKFRDHTFARAISDWPGAWRNWMRKANDDVAARAQRELVGRPQETPGHRQAREAVEVLTGGRASAQRPGDGPPPGHPASYPLLDEEPHVAHRSTPRLLR